MAGRGIDGFVVETRNWGKTAAFWQQLGYTIDFETDHNSGRLSHPEGGPFIFVVERPEGPEPEMYPIIGADDANTFVAPAAGSVEHAFEPRHWDVVEMMLLDPDGRHLSVQAPLPEGVEAPAGHH